jgi:hypothetical protein
MTMINTDAPGVTVEVTTTVPVTHHAATVRLQSWVQYDDPEHPGDRLVDLRFTVEQATQLAHALLDAAVGASVDNLSSIDVCPAGGPHTPTNDSSHPDRMTDPYWHCDECHCSLPTPEREEL